MPTTKPLVVDHFLADRPGVRRVQVPHLFTLSHRLAIVAAMAYGDGTVKHVGGDRYQLRWEEGIDPWTSKRIQRSKTIHAKNITAARAELRKRTAGRRNQTTTTLGELLDSCIDRLPIGEGTRTTYRYALAHVPPPVRAWRVDEISVVDARTFVEGLRARVSPQQVRKTVGAIQSCWREAVLQGWVAMNPWSGQRLPPMGRSAGKVLAVDEVRALLEVVNPGVEEVWLRIHLQTGARPSEVVGLRSSHVHDMGLVFLDEKHDGIERPVAIGPLLAALIRHWQTCQRERALAAGVALDPDPWLISADAASAIPWQRSYAGGWRWRDLCGRAGLLVYEEGPAIGLRRRHPDSYRLYDLRHTNNTTLMLAGVDDATRADRIGNSKAVNRSVYTHSTDDIRAAEIAEQLLA